MKTDSTLKIIIFMYLIIAHSTNVVDADDGGELEEVDENSIGNPDPMQTGSGNPDSEDDLENAANRMKDDFTRKHAESPSNVQFMANRVVTELFRKRRKMSTMEIMQTLDDLRGIPRLHAMQIFERMDSNFDGEIDEAEFVALYGSVAAEPGNALAAMFAIHDTNGDGFISMWELLRQEASKLGYDYDLVELHKLAEQKFQEMDADGSGTVTQYEYITYMVYLITKSIGKIKKETEEFSQGS